MRLSVHLRPSMPPLPEVMSILADALVQCVTAFAIVTKYCDLVTENESWLKTHARVLLRRTSKFRTLSWYENAYHLRKEDHFLVLSNRADVQAVLGRLQDLAIKEAQLVGADTNAIAREGVGYIASTAF